MVNASFYEICITLPFEWLLASTFSGNPKLVSSNIRSRNITRILNNKMQVSFVKARNVKHKNLKKRKEKKKSTRKTGKGKKREENMSIPCLKCLVRYFQVGLNTHCSALLPAGLLLGRTSDYTYIVHHLDDWDEHLVCGLPSPTAVTPITYSCPFTTLGQLHHAQVTNTFKFSGTMCLALG